MEKEIILILKDLEILYPSLYDLFNKNFTQYGNSKKFAKISYENNQSLLYVNDNFHIIVLVNEKNINYEDKPFLNRFEKHILSLDNILDLKELKIANDFNDSINKLIKLKDNKNEKDLDNNLINLFLEKLKILIFEIKIKNKFSVENLLSKIVPLFTQEMIFLLNYNDFIIEGESKRIKIKLIFKEKFKNNYNIISYLSNLDNNFLQNFINKFSNKNINIFKENKKIFNSKLSFNKTFILDANENIEIEEFITNIKKLK